MRSLAPPWQPIACMHACISGGSGGWEFAARRSPRPRCRLLTRPLPSPPRPPPPSPPQQEVNARAQASLSSAPSFGEFHSQGGSPGGSAGKPSKLASMRAALGLSRSDSMSASSTTELSASLGAGTPGVSPPSLARDSNDASLMSNHTYSTPSPVSSSARGGSASKSASLKKMLSGFK